MIGLAARLALPCLQNVRRSAQADREQCAGGYPHARKQPATRDR